MGHKSSATSSMSFELRWGSLELALELALDLNLPIVLTQP